MEQVYEIIDSTRVVGNRITTACWPYDGIMSFGSYVFTGFQEVTIGVVSGYAYQELNGGSGYQAVPAGSVNPPIIDSVTKEVTYAYDKPIKGAVIRAPSAWNYVSYSRSNGFYSGFTTLYTVPGITDLEYKVTAIHPLTMQRETKSGMLSGRNQLIKDLNFKLAEKNTIPPDKSSPSVEMDVQIVPGQAADVKFVAGTLPVNAIVQVPVTVFDQWMTAPPTMTIQYKSLAATVYTTVASPSLTATGTSDYKEITDTGIMIKRYEYLPSFGLTGPLNNFQVTTPGLYLFTVTATDATGNPPTIRSLQVRVVEPGEIPEGRPGAPVVDEILPKAGATNIMINAPVTVSFSEPVDESTLTADTFKLIDVSASPNRAVDATITTFIENGRMKASLTPIGNLAFDRTYEVVLTRSIKDKDESKPLDNEYRARFTTKKPLLYDLTSNQFTGGRDIELFNDPDTCGTYAYVAAGDNGYRVVNVTDPKTPAIAYPENQTAIPKGINYRCVGIGSDGTFGMTENIQFADGNQYGYARFYDLLKSTINIKDIKEIKTGQEKIAEAMSGIPGRIAVSDNYAYIATAGAALQIVDINAAKAYAKTGQMSDGSTIVGAFDTIGQGYGSPNDIIVYKPGKAFLTTNPGDLISLDLSEPSFPILMNASRPNGISVSRIAVATDYSYKATGSATGTMDLAVTGSREGKISTINVTDPFVPSYITAVTDQAGADLIRIVRDIAINKNSGLAFAITIDAVLVIDIKDPYKPKLLNEIKLIPGTTTPIGSNMALTQRDGWVYLASDNSGMRIMDFYTPPLNAKEAIITVDSVNNLFLDTTGKTLNDLKVKYTINPPGYQARSATVILVENNNGILTKSGAITGTGTVVFPKGMSLKKDAKYEVYVVINCNSPDAKVSERKAVNVNSLAIQDKKNPCNKAPGKNFIDGLDTLLLAVNKDNKATIQMAGGAHEEVVWKIKGTTQTGSFANPEIEIEHANINDVPEKRLLVSIDSNGNSKFDDSDQFMAEFRIVLATKYEYDASTIDLNAGWAAAGLHLTDVLSVPAGKEPLRLSSALLATFMGAKNLAVIQPDPGSTIKSLESTDSRLTHISGAEFVPIDSTYDVCKADLIEYVYSSQEVSDIIVNSKTITNWYEKHLSDEFVAGTLKEGAISMKEVIVSTNSTGESSDFRKLDYLSDTHLAIGGHTRPLLEGVAYVVKVTDINKLCVESINITGVIEDLYDWDYFSGGLVGVFAKKAASVQAGWNSGLNEGNSEKGKLFFTKFKFNKTKELFEYRYDMLGNQYKQYSLCY